MAAATWDEVRLQLLARGYRQVSFLEVACSRCGDWRGGVDPDLSENVLCPKCGQPPVAVAAIARGFTRSPTEKWIRIGLPVPAWMKTGTLDEDVPHRGARLPVFRGTDMPDLGEAESDAPTPKAEKTLTSRDVAILKLLAADHHPDSVATKLDPPTSPRAIIQTMFRVRKLLGCQTTAGACCKALRQGLI